MSVKAQMTVSIVPAFASSRSSSSDNIQRCRLGRPGAAFLASMTGEPIPERLPDSIALW